MKLFLLSIFISLNFLSFAQDTVKLTNQNYINNFNSDSIFSSLVIETDSTLYLDSLNNIIFIENDLIIRNCNQLLSNEYFKNLEYVGGNIKIINNNLVELKGFENIIYYNSLEVFNNSNLETFVFDNYNTNISKKSHFLNNSSLREIDLATNTDTIIVNDNENLGILRIEQRDSINYIAIQNNPSLHNFCDVFNISDKNNNVILNLSNNSRYSSNPDIIESYCTKEIYPCGKNGVNSVYTSINKINNIDCKNYLGGITIESDDISNLTELNNITNIDGNLIIQNCNNLASFNLTNTLDSVGLIRIINNPRLKEINIEGIESTRKISISNNDSLTQINLNNNSDSLIIENNNQLETCCNLGFNPNSDDTTKVNITNNASGCNSLESLNWSCNKVFFPCGRQGYTDTFNTAESINNIDCNHYLGSMIINYDTIDEPIEFYAPNKISGNLTIQNNNTITDLFFLENLDSIKILKIENCNNLKTINGLNIKSIDTLTLQNNNKLYACDEIINLIDSGILNSDQIKLDSNARSCNNLNQIQHFKRQIDYPCGEPEITDTLIYQFEIDSFNCQYFTGSLIIKDNQILNLVGLKNLKSINHSLSLINLSIDSIDTLALNVTEKFTIKNNNELKNISNIVLREAASVIEISNNDSLSIINYLPFGDSLIIKNNKSLDNCCIMAENLFEESDRYIFIDSNNTNCSGLNAIKNYCLETTFPCGIIGVTDTFKENSDFDIECMEYNGNMYVTGSNLDAIDSSNNIIYINGDLIMEGINQPNLFGFENIENINGNLIFKNNSIINLKAFRNLYEIQNRLIVDSNNRLTNSPIDAETFVRNITLTNNESMRFLYFGDGQTNQNRLKSVEISGNQNLESIDGMFSNHMDSIKISNNLNLISINAITFTDTVYDILEIRDNPKLSECCSMEPLLNSLSDTSSTVINISNNADSCISVESILNNCQVFTSYKQQKYNTYDLKINQNNSSFIELSGSALENSDKIYVIGITGNIIACLPYNNSKKQTLNIENYPSGLYLIAASSENRVLKAVKLFKK